MPDGNGVTTGAPADVLNEEQKARGQALLIARDILSQRGTGPFASVSLNGSSVWDLISAAEYVLTGQTLDVDDPEPKSAVIVAVPDEALPEARILHNAGHGVLLVPLSARLVSFGSDDPGPYFDDPSEEPVESEEG